MNSLFRNRPSQEVTDVVGAALTGADGVEDVLVQVIQFLMCDNLTDNLPKRPTKSGAGWWIVAAAATLGIGGVILAAAALAFLGIRLTDDA
jgi:hypothetical protein